MNDYKIYLSNGAEMPASDYQAKIFDNIKSGVGNMVINAAAGSAKTTTIVNALRFIPEDKNAMFIAFNTSIVEDIKKIVNRERTKICTFHSLGYSILKENKVVTDNTDLFEYKYYNYIKNNINNITRYKEIKSLSILQGVYISNIKNLVEYSRYYLAMTTKEITRIANLYGIAPIRDEVEVCREVLIWGKEHTDTIDFTDMIWLPNVLNLPTQRYLYDWIFIDEAQDTSITEQHIVEKCIKRNTRFVAVGDEAQQINTWCGSTEEAINIFRSKPNTNDYDLTISYRCPKKVIELAKKYGRIEAAPDAIEGEVNYDTTLNDVASGDMILCRMTAPLIDTFLKLMKRNKKAYISGFEDVRACYDDLLNNCTSKQIDRNCMTVDGMFPMLYKRMFNELDKVKDTFGLNDKEAMMYPTIIKMYDNIEGLKVLSEGLTTVDQLREKVQIIFEGDPKDAVILSTVHKAKGLESDNVFILMPSLMPSSMARKPWEIKAEENLLYVAITRAKKTLNFMEEKKNFFAQGGFFNLDKMYNDFKDIAETIQYNSIIGIHEEELKTINPKVKTLGGAQSIEKLPDNNKKVKGGLKFRNLM